MSVALINVYCRVQFRIVGYIQLAQEYYYILNNYIKFATLFVKLMSSSGDIFFKKEK